MTVFGSYRDLAKRGAIGSFYADSIHACHKCHFAGYQSDFKKSTVTDALKRELLGRKSKKQGAGPLDDVGECRAAARTYQLLKRTDEEIGNVYLIASYLLRGNRKRAAERKQLQRRAAEHFARAWTEGKIAARHRAVTAYLVGELERRAGRFDEALRWFGTARKQKMPKGLETWINEQAKLARKKDDNNSI